MRRLALLSLLLTPGLQAATVTIDATRVVAQMSPALFGQNWNMYEKSGDGSDAAYNAAIKAMGSPPIRIPGGGFASMRIWDDFTCGGKDSSWILELQGAINLAKATGSPLQPIVNFGGNWCDKDHGYDAAIQKAAAWVQYMNVAPKAYPCTYWEIGNEVFYKGDKSHTDGTTYGTQYARFHKAMKKVDPSIKLGFNLFENRDKEKLPWNQAALTALKASGVVPDFWVIHSYPIWMPKEARTAAGAPDWNKALYADNLETDATILKNVELVEKWTQELNQTISESFGAAYVGKIPFQMTEFRSVLELKMIEWVDALYSAQVILEMGRLGWQGSNIWAMKNGFDEKTKADMGILRTGRNADPDDNPQSSPRPSYYVYPYLNRAFGKTMVAVTSDTPSLRAWAGKDGRGDLSLFVVNNSLDADQELSASVSGYKAAGQAKLWVLEGAGTDVHGATAPLAHLRDIKINGVLRPDPSKLPAFKVLDVSGGVKLKIPALSMALIRLSPAK